MAGTLNNDDYHCTISKASHSHPSCIIDSHPTTAIFCLPFCCRILGARLCMSMCMSMCITSTVIPIIASVMRRTHSIFHLSEPAAASLPFHSITSTAQDRISALPHSRHPVIPPSSTSCNHMHAIDSRSLVD